MGAARRLTAGDYLVGLFTLGYLGAAVPWALRTGNNEFVIYIVVMGALVTAVVWVHSRVGLSLGSLWMLSIWGLVHMAGGLVAVPAGWAVNGEVRVLYSWWVIPPGAVSERFALKYDQVVHGYGFAVTTWVCWQGLRAAVRVLGAGVGREVEVRPTFGLMVLCAAAGMGFGAMNEIVEFFATLLVPSTNVGGYVNTGWDLVFNMIGSVGAAAAIWFSACREVR